MTTRSASGVTQARADAELEELHQKIASLKQQRWFALLGLVGTVIAFLIGNLDKIRNLVVHQPRVQVVSDDRYVTRNAVFTISRHGRDSAIAVTDSVAEGARWHTIEAGTYTLVASVGNQEVLRQDFTVEDGEKRSLVIPGSPTSSIRVLARNMSGPIGPGTQLEFLVEASGNGFLWVVERQDSAFALIYPEGCLEDCDNAITAGTGYHLPDSKSRALFAGGKPKQERLLFLVTSSPKQEAAQRLIRLFDQAIVTKAESGTVAENWGYAEVTYEVKAP